jgi:hypothetical protein
MAVGFFSPPYTGETLYSCIARHLVHTGLSPREYFLFYFKRRKAYVINQRLPCNIQIFADLIKDVTSITADSIIQNHTLFRFYGPFMEAERAKSLYSFMLKETGHIQSHVKLTVHRMEFSYCRFCAEEDAARFGESFWYLAHSIPFAQVCRKHGCLLSIWRVPPERQDIRKYYVSHLYNLEKVETQVRPSSILLRSCQKFESILDQSLKLDFDAFHEQAKRTGFILQRKNAFFLNKSLFDRYVEYLEKGGSELAAIIKTNPVIVKKLFNGRMTSFNPQNFVFLTDFLDSLPTIKSQNDLTHKSNFKQVTCCNQLCTHFEKTIPPENYRLLKIRKKTIMGAKGRCPFCGIQFIKSVDQSSNFQRISDYGTLTREFVHVKLKEGISIHRLRLELGIDNRQLKKMADDPAGETYSNRLAQKRALWEIELNSKEFISLTKSTRKLSTLYAWLLRNDREWTNKMSAQFRVLKGRLKTNLTEEDVIAFKNKLTNIRTDALKNQIRRRISLTFYKASLSARERTILGGNSILKWYCQSLIESHFEFKLRRIDYFLEENPELSFTKSFIFSKFKISYSIDGAKKEQLQNRFKNLIL